MQQGQRPVYDFLCTGDSTFALGAVAESGDLRDFCGRLSPRFCHLTVGLLCHGDRTVVRLRVAETS